MGFILQDAPTGGSGGNSSATAISSATSTNSSAWGTAQNVSFTATGQTLSLPTPIAGDIAPVLKTIVITNTGTNPFTIALTGGTITSAVGLVINPGTIWTITAQTLTTANVSATNAAQGVIPEFGTALFPSANVAVTANSVIMSFTLPSAGTWDVQAQIATNYNALTGGRIYFRNSTLTEVPNSRGYLQGGSQGAMSILTHLKAQITTTGAETFQVFTDVAIAAVYGYDVPTPAQGGTKVIWNKISGAVPVTGQSVAIGQVILNNQIFATPAFVASTNGSYVLPVAGTYSLRYDIATDGTGSNTNSHIAIFDGAGNLVPGTERVRGGSVTTSQMLSAEIQVTIASPTTYTLRARNGGGGTVTILNGATTQSQITWEQLGTSATTGFVGATQALAGTGGTVPAPLLGQQNFSLRGDGTWGTGALNLTAGTLSGIIGGVTFTITNGDPMTLTTSIAMTGFVAAELFQVAVGATYDAWRIGGSGLASAGNTLIRGGSWNGATSRGIGISNAAYCSVIHGYLIGNGRTFRISGGSTNGAPNVIIEVVA